ncbi:serine-rich protein [Amanita rubescens]|nr:serine-rich protein [Amanita rubescens]
MMSINARNVNSMAGIPKSLTEVIAFLTRPLVVFYTPSEIAALEVVLKTTLTAAYFASREPHLFLMLSPESQPPRPILAACIAACVRWADWIVVLGGKELDILVEPSRAVIRYGGQDGTIKTIWQESSVYRPQLRVQVPPSIHERPSGSFLRATVDSAVSRAQGRTKAQELLASNDKEETDEIFALLSNVTGITPTPTFEQFQIDNPSSGSSPDSSRPSSRSSNFSFFSLASSTDSMTSCSSTFTRSGDVPEPEDADESQVHIDKSKKTVQKYLYQGGISTVLTGGVMLGSAKKGTRDERPASGKPLASPFGRQRGTTSNGNWRRL